MHNVCGEEKISIFSFSLPKIHQHLVDLSTCDNRLKGVSWRIDVKMKSKHTEQLNQPSAIVEMQLGKEKVCKLFTCQILFSLGVIMESIAPMATCSFPKGMEFSTFGHA